MLWTCIKKELLQMILTKKFQICLVMSVVLLGISLYVSTEKYISKKDMYDREVARQQIGVNSLLALDESEYDKIDYSLIVNAVFRKPTPLSIFCLGTEENYGTQVQMGTNPAATLLFAHPGGKTERGSNTFNFSESLKDTFESIDFIFCVRLVLSLMAVFLAFDLVSGEREKGTLKLIHAQNVPRLIVIIGKWLAGSIIIGIVMIFMFLLSLLYISFLKRVEFDYLNLLRMAILYGVSLLYIILFYQITLFISTIARSSKHVVVNVFIVWSILCFVVPTLGIETGKYLFQAPSLNEITQVKNDIWEEYRIEITKARDEDRETITPGKSRRVDVWRQYQGQLGAIDNNYLNRLRRQGNLTHFVTMISPAHLYQVLSQRIMGTAVADYETFMDQARQVFNSYWETALVSSWLRKTQLEQTKLYIQCYVSAYTASQEDNRFPIRKSLLSMVVLLVPIIVFNSILFVLIILCYDWKPIIL